MNKLWLLLTVPALLAGCASEPAVEVAEPEPAMEQTRLADDVQEGEEWTDTPGDQADMPEPMMLTEDVVAQNDSEDSCWSIIDGQVYDLTDWISQHPGGASRIISLCGSDGTSQFQGKHGGQPAPESTLERYLLGPVAAN
jgi:cytochrome b involved in lipid metabolism